MADNSNLIDDDFSDEFDCNDEGWCDEIDESEIEDDGQPTEYEEWQDLYGGDDWDQGQYDHFDEY